MKIHQVRAELFHSNRQTDGRTDITKLIGAFRNNKGKNTGHIETTDNMITALNRQACRDNVIGTEPNRCTIKTGNHFKIVPTVLYGSTLLHTPT
jgi:hypothetical protein